ncbi:hypothetical protein PENTCL1PPCAC_23832, partial [Pristionchus entomophagus]
DSLSVMEKGDATASVVANDPLSGVIRIEVDNVSALDLNGRYTPEHEVEGVPWRVNVCKYPSGHLGVFLGHCNNASNIWSIDVSATVSLFKNDGKANPLIKKINKTFNHGTPENWGYSKFILWEELIDKNKDSVKDDKLTIEVRFTLSNIIGFRMIPRVD